MHGFMHPLSGLDHQLAMILVGIFAYQLGGRALWLVPLTFVSVMAVGGFLGIAGMPVPFIEIGIALSVIVLGAIVAFGVKAPLAVAMGIVGLFAIFHGHAHGSEMPLDASGLEYGLGFMLATALLHAVGIGIGFMIGMTSKEVRQQRLSRCRRTCLGRRRRHPARRHLIDSKNARLSGRRPLRRRSAFRARR